MRQRLNEISLSLSRYSGARDEKIAQKVNHLEQLEHAVRYLDAKDAISAFIDELQNKLQQGDKQYFEDLLTNLLQDIFPGSTDRVHFELSTKNNRPHLEILIEKLSSDGTVTLEDIYDDKGGSITNVISMGLRFIVLSRTTNRKFLIFDEADCWLSPEKVPLFARVLSQLSRELGVQVVYITHHDASMFAEQAKVIELVQEDDAIYSDVIASPAEPLDEDRYIQQVDPLKGESALSHIRLIDFKSHQDTLIELASTVTVIIGANDLGKSAIVQAFHAVCRNEGRQGLIRRGANKAVIEIGLENEHILRWEYRRKGKHKTQYGIYDQSNTTLQESRDGRNAPAWLDDYLAMPLLDQYEVHINHQKDPIFMLGRNMTGSQRAQLISLSDETEQLQAISVLHNQRLTESRIASRQAKKAISALEDEINALRFIEKVEADCIDASDYLDSIEAVQTQKSEIEKILELIEEQQASIDRLAALPDVILPEKPKLNDLIALKTRGREIAQIEAQLRALPKVDVVLPEVPQIKDLTNLAQALSKIETLEQQIGLNEGQVRAIRQEFKSSKQALDNCRVSSCPTCGQAINSEQEVA